MAELLEFGFDDVDTRDVEPLFLAFVGPNGLTPIQSEQLKQFLVGKAGDTVAIWPIILLIGSYELKTGSLHAWPTRNTCWVEIVWDMCEVADSDLGPVIKAFHLKAIEVATRYGIREYYGGLEPAHRDENTRVFTREEEGPLRLGQGT